MTAQMDGQLGLFDLDTWCGRTCLELSQAEAQKGPTSQPSSKRSSKSQSRAPLCVCVPNGGWTKSGCYYSADGNWSIAWRLHDAQFWGVPQRRKRIALVADFGGLSAPEILFVRKGVRGDFEESGEAGQGIARGAESGVGDAIAHTLAARADGSPQPDRGGGANITMSAAFRAGNGPHAKGIGYAEEQSPTLPASDSGTNLAPVTLNLLQDPITSFDCAPCLSSGNTQNGQAMLGVLENC